MNLSKLVPQRLKNLFQRQARLSLIDGIEYRAVDPQKDFKIAYDIFKRTIGESVKALNNGVWPEEERNPFFWKGFQESGMYMLLHQGRPIGCFSITELDLPVIREPQFIVRDENDKQDLAARPTYRAVVLQRMYIEPEFQHKGIGKALMNMALAEAHRKNLPLELEVLQNNYNALGGYEKNGYRTYNLMINQMNGWNRKFLMRHKDTEQYLPAHAALPAHDGLSPLL